MSGLANLPSHQCSMHTQEAGGRLTQWQAAFSQAHVSAPDWKSPWRHYLSSLHYNFKLRRMNGFLRTVGVSKFIYSRKRMITSGHPNLSRISSLISWLKEWESKSGNVFIIKMLIVENPWEIDFNLKNQEDER